MRISEFESEFRRKIIVEGGDYATAKVYGNCISVFMKHFEEKYDTPLKITSRDMEDYIIYMREQNHSSSYINQFIASKKKKRGCYFFNLKIITIFATLLH